MSDLSLLSEVKRKSDFRRSGQLLTRRDIGDRKTYIRFSPECKIESKKPTWAAVIR